MARRRLKTDTDQFAGAIGKYRPEFDQRVYEFMAQGNSIVQFAAHVGVHVDTVYNWAEQRPSFLEGLNRGRTASEAWWEHEYKKMMYIRDVNSPLVIRYMATRFKWTDRSATDHTSSDKTMSPTINVLFE